MSLEKTPQEPLPDESQTDLSRRSMIGGAAVLGAAALPLLNVAAGSAEAQKPAAAPPRVPQGGSGAIRVLLITKDHPFERSQFFDMFDALGKTISWTHVEQPAAEVFFDPAHAKNYDVFVLYDRAGRVRRTNGKVSDPGDRNPRDVDFVKPSPELQHNLKTLLQSGNKGFVFFHHSLASWVHTWPEYPEIVGAAADWDYPFTLRGKEWPYSGFRGGVQQHISVVDKSHPVVQGLGDGYDIVDETYLCPMFENSVHPLLRTDFKPVDSNFPMQSALGWHHPPGSNLSGWYKSAENTPVVYLQNGHGPTAWENPAFRTLMTNAIQWVHSPEAKHWAKSNPSRIFKST